MANDVNTRLVCVGARIEPELAAAMARLAEDGDRTVSRQIRRGIVEHVASSQSPVHAMTAGEGRGGAVAVPAAARREDRTCGRGRGAVGAGDAVRDLQPLAGDHRRPGALPRASQPRRLPQVAEGTLRRYPGRSLHGKDPSLGPTVLGKIEEIREEADGAIARVNLFRAVPGLLLDGLRAGVYGASFRGEPIKSETNWHPGISRHNPEGIPEVTRLEIRLRDIGPTPFAAYEGTTAMVAGGVGESLPARSSTAEQLDSEPTWLLRRDSLPAWQLQREDFEPAWLLRRREQHHGRTYAKA